jgi:hypothetical protein
MAGKSFAIPHCSVCQSKMQKDEQGQWFCLTCANDWLEEFVKNKVGDKSIGGVVLPTRVVDERRNTPSFKDLMPNRRYRRQALKRGS